MSRLTTHLGAAAVIGQLVGSLGWIDPLFLPLVLVAPVVTGAIAASRRIGYAWIAVVWCSAGINMAWSDWVVNREDLAFHLILSIVMPVLAGVGYAPTRRATQPRRAAG